MKYDDIKSEWTKDCNIDKSDLANESLKIPRLHNKYFVFYIQEKAGLLKLNIDYDELYKVKMEYYLGKLTEEELKVRKWEQFNLRLIKPDSTSSFNTFLAPYLNADKDLNELRVKVSFQKEKIEFLESIIKNLNNRNFSIRNAMDFIKFENGIS